MSSLVGESMAIDEQQVLLAAERALETPQIGRARRKSLREVHSEQQGKVSDKWLRYFEIYEAAFAMFREQPVRILEIGVQNGGSLEVWAKYFPRATVIVGCDIDSDCGKLRYDDDRIKLVIGDACSAITEREIVAHSAEFDIIIDDGSHKSSDIIKGFARYFGHLTNSGVYLVEDLHCSYRQAFEGGLYDPHSSMSFFKRLVDITNSEHWGLPRQRVETLAAFAEKYAVRFDESLLASVSSVEFSNSLCLITKDAPGRNELGLRRVAGNDAVVLSKLLVRDGTLIQGTDESANPWALDTTVEAKQISKLQFEHESLVEVAKAREQTIAGLRTRLEEAERNAAAHDAKAAELEGAIALYRRKQLAQDASVVAMSAERDALKSGVRNAEEAHQATRAQLVESKKTAEDLVARQLHELAQVQLSLADAKDWVFRLSAERTTFAKQSQHLEQRLAEQMAKLEQTTANQDLLVSQKLELTLRLDDAASEITSARGALAESDAEARRASKEFEARLSDRFDEIAALTGHLRKIEAELAAARGQVSRNNDEEVAALRSQVVEKDAQLARRFDEIAALTQALQQRTGELSAARESLARLQTESSALTQRTQEEKKDAEARLAERFSEIARLTRIVSDAEALTRKATAQREWIREAASVLVSGSRSWKGGLLPSSWRRNQHMAQLKEKGLFDPAAYLAAYPDVARSAQDALRHYIRHGLVEGRELHAGKNDGTKS